MNYIIDGHNLIAHLPVLSLSMPDDEERLIQLLNRFGEQQKGGPPLERAGTLEVYFDAAPIGQAGVQNYGRMRVHFVPQSQTADDAIRNRLAKLTKSARNWKVVSSDRSIQAAAREVHAGVLKAEDFARQIEEALRITPVDPDQAPDKPLSPAEVDEWLAIFKQRKSIK